jgi:predicted metalloprotease
MHDPDSSQGERHMDIRGRNRSSNIEDRRGMSPVRKGVGLSIGGVLFLIVLSLFGINPLPFLGVATKQPEVQMQQSPQPYQESAEEKELADVAGVTLAETEVTWNRLFEGRYPAPTMVMYNEMTPTGCGTGQAAMGPFYCPLDQKVYVDLTFFRELEQKFGAPGDFAQAYVIAHEVGHHVQHLTGAADKVRQAQQRARSKAEANQYSVMLELQADCYAGVWARDAAQRLQITQQDIEEGMRAASAIGDDRLQRASQGRIVPDAFTHGTSEQRMRWLMTGMKSGDPNACDTFSAKTL